MTGAHVEYVDVPPAAACEGFVAAGMSDWPVRHLDGAFAKFRAGEFAATTDAVAVLTGLRPRSVADFLTDDADAFTPIDRAARLKPSPTETV